MWVRFWADQYVTLSQPEGTDCVPTSLLAHPALSRWLPTYLTDVFGEKEALRPTHFSYYQVFLCIFHENLAMAALGLKEM